MQKQVVKIGLLFLILFVTTELYSKDTLSIVPRFSHSIYGEFLGTSIFLSGNYELSYHYTKTSRNKLSLRLGTGTNGYISTFLFGFNISLGKRKNFLQMGVNRMLDLGPYIEKKSLTSFGVGYRHQGYRGLYFNFIPTLLHYDHEQGNWESSSSIFLIVSIGLGVAF